MLLVHFLDICHVEEKMGFTKEKMLGFSPSVSARTDVRSFLQILPRFRSRLSRGKVPCKGTGISLLRMKHISGTVLSHLTWFILFKQIRKIVRPDPHQLLKGVR